MILMNFSKPKSNDAFIIISLLTLIIWAVLFFGIKNQHETNLNQVLQSNLEKQETNWTAVQTLFKGNVEFCFNTFIKTPEIIQLLQKAQDPAQQKQARIDLYRALYDHYQQRLNYTNNRFDMSIHTADNHAFLRFSQPTVFGDDLSRTRPIIKLVQQTLEPIHSFDTGRILASYHHIMPVVYQGQFLGSVEYGRPFSSIEEAIKEFSPATEFSIIYQKKHVEKTRLKTFDSLYATSLFSNEWLEEDPDGLLDTSPPVATDTFKQIANLAKNDADFQSQLASGLSFSSVYQIADQYYMVALSAIPDIENRNFAYLISATPSKSVALLMNQYPTDVFEMSFLLLFASFIIYRMFCSFRKNRIQSQYLQSVHNTMSEGVYVTDMHGKITMINSAALNILGYKEREVLNQNAHLLFHNPENPSPSQPCPLEDTYENKQHFKGELQFKTAKKQTIWVDVSSEALIIDEVTEGAVIVFTDITAQRIKDDTLRISATAFESQDGIMITDPKGIILRVNQSFKRLTGYSSKEVIGQTPKILSSGRQKADFYEAMWEELKARHFWQGEIWNRRKDGQAYLEWLTITAVLNDEEKISHYVANFSDITERQMAQDEIQKLAFYDSLTQLPNRRLLLDRLEQAIRYTKRSQQCGALLFIDLDNFKTLNDSKGHMIGDLLLQEVAKRLQNAVREVDTIARLGGDEFVVLLENLGECKVDAVHQSEKMAKSILDTFNAPFMLDNYSHHSSPSIGVEIVHPHNLGSNEILAHADLAMYQAKKQGRNTVRFFNENMQVDIEKMAELQSDLRQALADNILELYYQPQVNQFTEIIAAEALIRWKHPTKGFISPADFIPMAENSGLIIPVGDFVLETALNTLVEWAKKPAFASIKLSVNVSAKQFADINFVSKVKQAVKRSGVNPNNLKLELTESIIVKDVESTIQTMNDLRDIGIRFSMDDFGTGHSSLAYIKRLPLSQLKIDQSFIRDVTTDSDDATIVKTIIAMSNTLNLEVIAEGVETVEQKDFLKENQCNIYQGYLFSRPLPLQEFNNLIDTTSEINDFDFDS